MRSDIPVNLMNSVEMCYSLPTDSDA